MADITEIRDGRQMTFGRQLKLTILLSTPAILAQLSSIAMQYIDASMVGHLGAVPSAAIGLVASGLWLFCGICTSVTTGFSVQVAHRVGAKDYDGARHVLRQGLTTCLAFSILVALIGVSIAHGYPLWLGGNAEVSSQATLYFAIFVMSLPLLTMSYFAGAMLRSVGNMKVPSALNILMCVFDCLFNFMLIFPSRHVTVGDTTFYMPGAGLGIVGAALGTVLAEAVVAVMMFRYLYFRQPELRLAGLKGDYRPDWNVIKRAFHISVPMGLEHGAICGAQIAVTAIVAPLGVIALAANTLAVTAESLCYMPGYGIGDAATTLVGQSYGAGRRDLVKRFSYISVGLGMTVMTVMGILLWIGAPYIMELMTPVAAIRDLGAEVLRIEAWAEPMFAASIVTYGVFVGVGHTVIPAIMNLGSIWVVRLPLAWMMVRDHGLRGVWIAMCIELFFRGAIFLARLISGRWLKPAKQSSQRAT